MNGIHEVRGSIPLASTEVTPLRKVTWHVAKRPPAGIAQLVEHNLAKVGVAGSSPVSRSRKQSQGSDYSDSLAVGGQRPTITYSARGGAVW